MNKKFHLKAEKSPTHANLIRFLEAEGWRRTWCSRSASINEAFLEFAPEICETLEHKHRLSAFLEKNQLTQLMPETFFINDHNWPTVLATLEARKQREEPWILKPSLLNNGQHIKIFKDLGAIKAHFLSAQRMGGPHVLQRYILKPQLIQGPVSGHKFSIRFLVLISTHAGSGLFPRGYLNIALAAYEENHFTQLERHLTNEHLNEERLNVVQRPSDEIALFQSQEPAVLSICQQVIQALKKQFSAQWQDKHARIACFGFDFMIEQAKQKLWLLEVNHGPCFPIDESHPLYASLYRPFWQQVIKQFIYQKPSDFIPLD